MESSQSPPLRGDPLGEGVSEVSWRSASVIAALRRGNLVAFFTDVRARLGELPAASAGMPWYVSNDLGIL